LRIITTQIANLFILILFVKPREVANTDQIAIDEDHIAEHKCSTKYSARNGLYTFKVNWADDTNTWEPYKAQSEDAKYFMIMQDLLNDFISKKGGVS